MIELKDIIAVGMCQLSLQANQNGQPAQTSPAASRFSFIMKAASNRFEEGA